MERGIFINLMYCTVKGYLPLRVTDDILRDIVGSLENVHEDREYEMRRVLFRGMLRNLRVRITSYGVYIEGSLAKYVYGNNIYTLDRDKTREAIEEISDSLHVDMGDMYVKRLDFGGNFAMSKEVCVYIEKLGNYPRLLRVLQSKWSLLYKHDGMRKLKELAFYDKVREMRKKGVAVPEAVRGVNLLRYELRLLYSVARQMEVAEVRGKSLYNDVFYQKLLTLWQDYYKKIKKKERLGVDMGKKGSSKKLYDEMFALFVSDEDVKRFVDEAKAKNRLKDERSYSRLLNMVKCAKKKVVSSFDDDIKELNGKIEGVEVFT